MFKVPDIIFYNPLMLIFNGSLEIIYRKKTIPGSFRNNFFLNILSSLKELFHLPQSNDPVSQHYATPEFYPDDKKVPELNSGCLVTPVNWL